MKKLEYQQPQMAVETISADAYVMIPPSPTINPVRRREPIAD